MGWASEQQIAELNLRYETDAEFSREYDERMQLEAALEADYFAREREEEKFEEWFDDVRVDHTGYTEIIEPAKIEIDDDIPF